MDTVTCADCGEFCTGSAFGRDDQDRTICYRCCGIRDGLSMRETGRATLYLVKRGVSWAVTNWPDSISFPVTEIRKGAHNMARVRYDFWFRVNNVEQWYGYQIGDNTEIAHCRRLKARA